MFESEQQFGTSLHFQLHTARTEYFIGGTDVELHVGDIEFLLVVVLNFAYFLLPVPVHDLALVVGIVFLLRQHVRCGDIRVADACVHHISARLRVVLHGSNDVARVLQIHRRTRSAPLFVIVRSVLFDQRRSPYSAIARHLRYKIRCLFGSNGISVGVGVSIGFRLFRRLFSFLRRFLFRHQFL